MNFRGLLAKIYFRNIIIEGNKEFDSTLILSNHRNGAIDGFVLSHVFGEKTKFVVGKNLTNYWFKRLFFGGQIEVYRKSETPEEGEHNKNMLKHASELIKHGTPVIMFPEGTSHLEKGFLPIKKGAALIVHTLGGKKIVPVGLHYERGWSFRSDVIVKIGDPVEVEGRNLTDKTESIRKHLESVYSDDREFKKSKKDLFGFAALTPLIALFFLMNFLAAVIPYAVAKKFADDKNVICLWKILSGAPAWILQLLITASIGVFNPWYLFLYIFVTISGLFAYRDWKDAGGIE